MFSGAVQQVPDAPSGSIVAVHTADKNLVGYGFYDPQSQIICRLFDFTSTPIELFDQSYWNAKVETALQLRHKLQLRNTTCFRLLHAEGDYLPGVVADVYDNTAVLQLRIPGSQLLKAELTTALQNADFPFVYLKNKEDKPDAPLENGWLSEQHGSTKIEVLENGHRFIIDIEKGQKTGFFIDQRDSRELLSHYSNDASVLNTFAYSGGFSVYALAGNATKVTSVDISKDACAMAERNVRLNFTHSPHEAVAADCFDYLKQSNEQWDVVVLDPPAFAKSKGSVPNATRGYKQLNMAGMKKVKKGGILFTFSCSQHISADLFQKIVFGAAADAGVEARILHFLSQPADHPINIFHPEGNYLKGLVLQIV